MSVIFAKTRFVYLSYEDFWELVKISEFETCYIDEIDYNSDNVYILTPLNGELAFPLPERKAKIIWLNIERPGENEIGELKYFDEVWMCDINWANKTNSKFFFMASDKRLGYTGNHDKRPISLCYENGRRQPKLLEYDINNVQCFGEQKRKLLSEAKAMVVYHQDVPVLSPQRFCACASAHLPILYEKVPDFYPFINRKDFLSFEYDDDLKPILENDLQFLGENLFDKMCKKTTFRKEVERLL